VELVTDESFVPRQYPGVMVSSTFNDLERHRAALVKAIEAREMHAVAMEQDAALPITVIDSSLGKVRAAAAYIGLISHRYGNVPNSAELNPDGLSLTELEFREARRLGRPMLIFIMGSEAVDYDTLLALSPFLPPDFHAPLEPQRPEADPWWKGLTVTEQREAQARYAAEREDYAREHRSWLASPELRQAARQLAEAVADLERRGLLQYDKQAGSYDLHPVVRGFSVGGLRADERDRLGQRAIDYFSSRPQNPYEQAETLDDVGNGLRLIRTLLQMDQKRAALDVYLGDLADALLNNLEASPLILSLLRPFFGADWTTPVSDFGEDGTSWLLISVATALHDMGDFEQSLAVHEAVLRIDLRNRRSRKLVTDIGNLSSVLGSQGRLARYGALRRLELEVANLVNSEEYLFVARLDYFCQLRDLGAWTEAEAIWQALDPMGRDWSRTIYRPGDAETEYAWFRFYQGDLTEEILAQAEGLARAGRNRYGIRHLHELRGRWQLGRGEFSLAADNLREAIRLARQVSLGSAQPEAVLALAKLRLGQLSHAGEEAERLSRGPKPPHLELAQLWYALDERARAAEHALAAYGQAGADGPSYTDRYNLERAEALLNHLGVPVPPLPASDPANDPPFPFEAEVREFITNLRAEQAADRPPA